MTKSERLMDKIGQLVTCDIHQKKVIFTSSWMMNMERQAVCPGCVAGELKKGKTLVGM